MKVHTPLPLRVDNQNLYVIDDELIPLKEELEFFLDGMDYMKSKQFSKNVLFSHEIQANNDIEGYQDDVSLVYDIIHKKLDINDEMRKKRILNLYKGYQYILRGKELNKDNLKELYAILSDGLLEQYDLDHMGEYYRKGPVYIFYSDRVDVQPNEGIPYENVEEYMRQLLEYMNGEHKHDCLTDTYIVSQIAHFYFCYIHPYFDINGRTSRTTAMWYLLKNEAYPYIIFNRGIQLSKQRYYKVIRDVIKFKNATFFLNYMMENLKKELEKEHIMELIAQSTSDKLTALDYQTLQYILSMNSEFTYYDFAYFYNHQNEKKKKHEIIKTMLEPLVDKDIIIPTRTTSRSGNENKIFKLNDHMYEIDPAKVKRINIAKPR